MIIAVDFDRVIHDADRPLPGRRMGAPIIGAVEAMQLLNQFHDLIIFSVMASSATGAHAIEDWCKFYQVPWKSITAVKPNADIFLDDKAVRFTDWSRALKDIDLIGRVA